MGDKGGTPQREKNPMADAANWNARVLTEIDAPHKWNEAWGQMFEGSVPHDYIERIKFLENELKNCPPVKALPKYGVGEPFPKLGSKDYRRKKMFGEITYDEPKGAEDASATAQSYGGH